MTEIIKGENKRVIEIDRHDDVIMSGLKEAPVYRKQGQVNAKIAEGGEVVITKLANGTIETKNTANPGDAIITNPSGEQYIISGEKFAKRYEPKEGEEGVFIAKGYCKAIDNPWENPITMMASWGEMQNGQADCKIADIYNPVDKTMGGEPYIIGLDEFNLTYKIVETQPNQ